MASETRMPEARAQGTAGVHTARRATWTRECKRPGRRAPLGARPLEAANNGTRDYCGPTRLQCIRAGRSRANVRRWRTANSGAAQHGSRWFHRGSSINGLGRTRGTVKMAHGHLGQRNPDCATIGRRTTPGNLGARGARRRRTRRRSWRSAMPSWSVPMSGAVPSALDRRRCSRPRPQ